MNILASFNEIFNKALKAIKTFPITILWAILSTFFTIWFVDQEIDRETEYIFIKIILTAVLGVSWLISTRLVIRYFLKERDKNLFWLLGIPLLFLAVYYLTLPNNQTAFNDDLTVPYRFVLFLTTGHLVVFFSPFIFTWNKNAYWNYLKNIFISFVTSAIFSLVIYLGLSLALLALKYLFKIELNDSIFGQLFIFCLGIINTWLFVAGIPETIYHQKNIDYPKALLVFVKYILIPLTILYLVILYAYSFKILINWDLPKGWVSYLVIALAVLGFIIHVLINPIQKTSSSRIIKSFYPWFYYALLPLLILLFTAIYKRIATYGVTENRYLVLVLSFWILGMTLYVLFSKRKKLYYFPMSVAIISLLVSFGFWGVFSVSKNSQTKQFTSLYAKMKAANFKVKQTEKDSFESIVSYLANRNALDKISDVLGYNPKTAFKDANAYNMQYKLIDTLGIKVVDFDKKSKNPYNGIYNYYSKEYSNLLHIKGYDFYKREYLSAYDNPVLRENSKIEFDETFAMVLDSVSRSALYLTKRRDTVQKIDLKDFLNSFETFNDYEGGVAPEKLTLLKESKDYKIKFIFEGLGIRKEKDQKKIPLEISYANLRFLLKEKNAEEHTN